MYYMILRHRWVKIFIVSSHSCYKTFLYNFILPLSRSGAGRHHVQPFIQWPYIPFLCSRHHFPAWRTPEALRCLLFIKHIMNILFILLKGTLSLRLPSHISFATTTYSLLWLLAPVACQSRFHTFFSLMGLEQETGRKRKEKKMHPTCYFLKKVESKKANKRKFSHMFFFFYYYYLERGWSSFCHRDCLLLL